MIIGQYHPVTGGAEKECQKLSGRLLKEGISVSVLTQSCEGLPDYEVIDEIPVYRKMKGWHWFEITYMLSVLRFLLQYRKRYDIIQCFGLYLFIAPALIMKYLFGKKVIARLECAGHYGDFWRITGDTCIESGDYLTNVAICFEWTGDATDGAILILDNALSVGGFALAIPTGQEEIVFPVTWEAHFTAGSETTEPWSWLHPYNT